MCLRAQGIDNDNGCVGGGRQSRGISNDNVDVGGGKGIYDARGIGGRNRGGEDTLTLIMYPLQTGE